MCNNNNNTLSRFQLFGSYQFITFVLFSSFISENSRKFELIEPQLSVLARFCVYCIISSLAKINEEKEDEQNQAKKLKRSLNENETSKDEERPPKKPKMDDSLLEILSDGTEKMDASSNRDGDVNFQSSSTKSPTKSPSSKSSAKKPSTTEIPEPLNGCLQNLFKTLHKLTFSSDLTPKVLFVRQFLIYLHRCGGESILPVLNIFPSDLMKNLLKIPNDSTFNYDFVLR